MVVGISKLTEARGTFSFMRGNILVMTICESVWRISVDIVWPFLSIYILELGGRYEDKSLGLWRIADLP